MYDNVPVKHIIQHQSKSKYVVQLVFLRDCAARSYMLQPARPAIYKKQTPLSRTSQLKKTDYTIRVLAQFAVQPLQLISSHAFLFLQI